MTDAGKRLLERWYVVKRGARVVDGRDGLVEDIAAIEAEAVAAEKARIRAAVEAAGHHIDCIEGCDCGFDAALAIIEGADDAD